MTLDERILSTPLPAGGTARQGANVELGDVVKVEARTRLLSDLPPQRPLRRDGDGRCRRALRSAGLRHARGSGRDRQDGLGRGGPPEIRYHGQPLDESRSRRCCGTANGR